jgi:hypothetical protein
MIGFTLGTRKNQRFEVGKFYRFQWDDLYRVLVILKTVVQNAEVIFLLDTMLGTSRELVHQYLWNLIEEVNQDESITNSKTIACLWVIACYGYMHGLKTELGSPWPHPRPLKRIKYPVQKTWRDELKCPFCLRTYKPPKSFRTKEAILKRFGFWMKKHLCEPH